MMLKFRAVALWVIAMALSATFTLAVGTTPLAWVRFDNPKSQYKGTSYAFLGSGPIEMTINIKPQVGQVLELRWGCKNDSREAVAVINGVNITITNHQKYDGFEWLPVAVPESAIKGGKYEVSLQRGKDEGGETRPAFIAEIRLTGPASASAATPAAPAPDLKARAFNVTSHSPKNAPADFLWSKPRWLGEAFPEMRRLWDREPDRPAGDPLFRQAERNARQAAEALYRCNRFVPGWLAYADPKTGLIPRNLMESRDFWNGRDSAADNYPFMVLTAALTDRGMFEGRMRQMLATEMRLTSRLGRLCDDYSFSRQGWRRPQVQLDDIIFDNAEYVKDGLIPLTEWLGPSPWSERMTGIMDDIWANAPIDTPFGRIPTLNFEVGGDLLQACSRLYWLTGQRKYLDWAIRLGDYYLLGNHHPTRDMNRLGLSDHACEVINGLSELYVAVSKAAPEKREAYRAPLHAIYDRILAIGRDPHGMLYSWINPKAGTHQGEICDTWGYDYDGFYTMWLLDGTPAYREAVRQVLGSLKDHYTGHVWQSGSADGYADSIEGAINLYNREPAPAAAEWIDSEIRTMWAKQHADGIIEGWHGDGNFARTSIMFALLKTQGVHVEPWRADVRLGAAADGQGGIALSLAADREWSGRVIFDVQRHKTNMHLPLDYPRINQFPEWFTVEAGTKYRLLDPLAGSERALDGQALADGISITLKPGQERRWRVVPWR